MFFFFLFLCVFFFNDTATTEIYTLSLHDALPIWMETWMPVLTDDTEPINPYRVIWEMNQTLDLENSIVTHDAGAPRDMLVPFFLATTPHSYIGWGDRKSTRLNSSHW